MHYISSVFNLIVNALSHSVFQLDIFEHVGVPLVENCMAGFNSSVFAYGQVCFFSYHLFIFLF